MVGSESLKAREIAKRCKLQNIMTITIRNGEPLEKVEFHHRQR